MQTDRYRRSLYVFLIFQFFKDLQFFGALAVNFYLDWARLDYTRIFLLEGFFVAAVFLLEVPTGVVADKWGRKPSLLLGSLLSGAGFVLFGLVNHYSLFFLANFLCAAGMTFYSGADKALLHELAGHAGQKEQSRLWQTRAGAFSSAGMMLGPMAGAALAGSRLLPYPWSLSLMFILSGGMFLVSGTVLLFLQEPKQEEKIIHPLQEGLKGIRHIFTHPPLRSLAWNSSLISALTFFIFWFYQSLGRSTSLPLWTNGLLCAAFNGLGMVLLGAAPRLEKALGLNRLLFLTALLPAAGFAAVSGFTANPWVTIPLIILIASMKLLRGPLMTDLVNLQTQSKNRATVLSGISMLERAVIGILYPVVGWAADRSLPLTLLGLGILTAATALVLPPPAEEEHSRT